MGVIPHDIVQPSLSLKVYFILYFKTSWPRHSHEGLQESSLWYYFLFNFFFSDIFFMLVGAMNIVDCPTWLRFSVQRILQILINVLIFFLLRFINNFITLMRIFFLSMLSALWCHPDIFFYFSLNFFFIINSEIIMLIIKEVCLSHYELHFWYIFE